MGGPTALNYCWSDGTGRQPEWGERGGGGDKRGRRGKERREEKRKRGKWRYIKVDRRDDKI